MAWFLSQCAQACLPTTSDVQAHGLNHAMVKQYLGGRAWGCATRQLGITGALGCSASMVGAPLWLVPAGTALVSVGVTSVCDLWHLHVQTWPGLMNTSRLRHLDCSVSTPIRCCCCCVFVCPLQQCVAAYLKWGSSMVCGRCPVWTSLLMTPALQPVTTVSKDVSKRTQRRRCKMLNQSRHSSKPFLPLPPLPQTCLHTAAINRPNP